MYILQNIKEFCSDFFGVACFPDDLAVVALGLDPSFTTFNKTYDTIESTLSVLPYLIVPFNPFDHMFIPRSDL
jgi:hypothetical protein